MRPRILLPGKSYRFSSLVACLRLGFAFGAAGFIGAAPKVRAGVEIAASTSYEMPGAPARMTEISWAPVALTDGGTAFVAKLEGSGEHVLVINRPNGLSFLRASALGLPATGGSLPFYSLASNGSEVLFVAASSANQSALSIYRADPAGPVLLVADVVAAAQQYRYGWVVGEWVARDGAFAMVSTNPGGRVGFGTPTATLSFYHAGTMSPVAVLRTGTPAFATISQLALSSGGTRLFFRGTISSTGAHGIYAWESGVLHTILDSNTRFATDRVSVGSFAIGDDQAIGFFDSQRIAIALFTDNRITELVARGTRADDGTPIELTSSQYPPRVLRVDARHIYFTAPRRLMNPWGEEGLRDDTIFRVPCTGGPAEVFFHPARVLADATRVTVSNLILSGEAPQLTFVVREIWGTQQAVFRATPPFGSIAFPAVPTGYPTVILKADWPDGHFRRAGERTGLEAKVEGQGPFTFEWFENGRRVSAATPHLRANAGTLTFFPCSQIYHSGEYAVAVTNATGTSRVTATVLVGASSLADGGTPPALVNYSVRGYSMAAEGTFTAGFSLVPPVEESYPAPYLSQVLTSVPGTAQRLLIRAVGPGLAPFARLDVVPAPATRLELFSGNDITARNDGQWSTDPAIAPTAAAVGAFPLQPGSRDSAVISTLTPGVYTAQAAAPAGDGTILMECYVVQGRGHLRNISARGFVSDNEPRSLTLGFVISGAGSRPVLLRAVGPGLRTFGVNQAASQPRLELFAPDNTQLAENTLHTAAPNPRELADTTRQFGAFPLAEGSADAAMLLHLPAGVYIARTTASPGSLAGIALVELYTSIGYERRYD